MPTYHGPVAVPSGARVRLPLRDSPTDKEICAVCGDPFLKNTMHKTEIGYLCEDDWKKSKYYHEPGQLI